MDPTIQAERERQQSAMLDKLSSIMDNKLDSMKRQLEVSSNTQMSELKKIRLSEPRSFKKKGHEQQYKHNDQVKSTVNEAKDAAIAGKTDACVAKLDEGIDLIDQRQKLILIADRSEYGWKTVGEYLNNELSDDEQDAKKRKKAEKEAQRKIAESRAVKAVKARAWYKTSRAPGATATSPSPSPLGLSTGSLPSRFYPSVGSTRSIGSFTFTNGTAQKRGTSFSCGKPGPWRNKCPVLVTTQTQQEGRKLSDKFSDLCVMDSMSGGFDFSESVDNTDITPLGQGDFLERECSEKSFRGRLKSNISAWEEIGSPDTVLAVIKEGSKLPLLTIPESRILANNNPPWIMLRLLWRPWRVF